jgi:hypothetical protein
MNIDIVENDEECKSTDNYMWEIETKHKYHEIYVYVVKEMCRL